MCLSQRMRDANLPLRPPARHHLFGWVVFDPGSARPLPEAPTIDRRA
jgi:hypothetical protein